MPFPPKVTPFHEVARRTECHPSDNSRGSPSSIPLRLWAPHRSTLSAVRRYTASATSLNPPPPRIIIIILFFSELGPNAAFIKKLLDSFFSFKVHHLCGAVKKPGRSTSFPYTPKTQTPQGQIPNTRATLAARMQFSAANTVPCGFAHPSFRAERYDV